MTAADTPVIKRRKAWVAVVLSLLAPGIGHIYCGRAARGLGFFLVTLGGVGIAIVVASLSEVATSPVAVTALLVTEAVGLYAVIESFLVARRTDPAYVLRRYNRWYVYLALFIVGTAPASAGTNLVLGPMKAFYIPNDSMAPTLVCGDRFVVERNAYAAGAVPARGDVIVFASPEQPRVTWVKRVVALAGDTVEIRGGELYVNDQRLPRTPAQGPDPFLALAPQDAAVFWESNGSARYRILVDTGAADRADFPRTTVPEGCLFVLGDHRDHSKDSRHVGPISLLAVRGQARYRYWPVGTWDRLGPVE